MKKAMRRAMKRRSKVAKGKLAKAVVFRGKSIKTQTSGGLKKADLTKNRNGKIVSRKASANGRKRYSNIRAWTHAVQKARKALNLRGFVAINGKSPQGKALYAKAKSFFSN